MWFVYPLLWIVLLNMAAINVFTLPILIMLYILDKDLFVDYEATEQADVYGKQVPNFGIPTIFAKYYSIHALLWGDFTYIWDKDDINISLTQMLLLLTFSIGQLLLSSLLELFFTAWAVVSWVSLSFIVFYEVFFLDLSFYDPNVDYVSIEEEQKQA